MDSYQWLPNRWKPEFRPGQDFVLTFIVQSLPGTEGSVDSLRLELGAEVYPLEFDGSVATVTVPEAEFAAVHDRSPARLVVETGGRTFIVLDGHLTKVEEG